MRMCQPHWDELRTEIKNNGLDHLVSNGREDAEARIKRIMAGSEDPKDYDPLISAADMIGSNAIASGGVYLLQSDLCPLCELNKNKEFVGEGSSEWIHKAVAGVREYCLEKKLIQLN